MSLFVPPPPTSIPPAPLAIFGLLLFSVLPSAAVEHGPEGLFAYVVRADSTVEARPIKTAEDTEGVTVVTDGLQAGERVVTTNQYRLQPGASVRTLAAALPPAAPPGQASPPADTPTQDAGKEPPKVAHRLAP